MRFDDAWERWWPRRWSADESLTVGRSGRRRGSWQQICGKYALKTATVVSAALPGEMDD